MPYLHDSANATLQTVYIEDFYNPDTATLKDAVGDKLTAIKAHLNQSMSLSGNASAQTPGVWFIAFASGYNGVTSTPNVFFFSFYFLNYGTDESIIRNSPPEKLFLFQSKVSILNSFQC
jgi:hypothetical protein